MGASNSKKEEIKKEEIKLGKKENPKQGQRIEQSDTKHAPAIPESSSEKLYNSIVKINVDLNEKNLKQEQDFL